MAQTAKAKLAEVSLTEASKVKILKNLVDIRVAPNSYFGAFFLAGFITGFLIYLGRDLIALALFAVSWILIPLFSLAGPDSF